MPAISPTQSQIQQALASFLNAVLPGITGFPAVFVGSINGTTLTVNQLPGLAPGGIQGAVQSNAPLLGVGVAPGTFVVQQLTGNSGGVGTYQISQTQSVGSATMSTGVSVVAGQGNRIVEPANPYFVVMTPMRSKRLSTNLDGTADCKFTGSITGTVLTVSAVAFGSINAWATIIGTGVVLGTQVARQLSGTPGGVGTYSVTVSQSLASGTLSAGQMTLLQDSEWGFNAIFHAPDNTLVTWRRLSARRCAINSVTSFFAGAPHR